MRSLTGWFIYHCLDAPKAVLIVEPHCNHAQTDCPDIEQRIYEMLERARRDNPKQETILIDELVLIKLIRCLCRLDVDLKEIKTLLTV